jgi:hypothetical protein
LVLVLENNIVLALFWLPESRATALWPTPKIRDLSKRDQNENTWHDSQEGRALKLFFDQSYFYAEESIYY